MTSELALASEFPTPTEEQWRTAVGAVLARSGVGPDVDVVEKLSRRTYDGLTLKPLYTAASAELPDRAAWLDSATGGWDVRQRHQNPSVETTRREIAADLAGGVDSLWLSVPDVTAVLDGVALDATGIVLDAGAGTVAAVESLKTLAGSDLSELTGSAGFDPVAVKARTGATVDVLDVVRAVEGTSLLPVTVDGTVYHDAGASDATEIGAVLSSAVGIARTLSGAGAENPFAQLELRVAVTADVFGSIAKLRALRRVWSRVLELSDMRAPLRLHAVTSSVMMTRRDPWVNFLRTTLACFAAAAGGADAITVAPFDQALGLPDDFARRMARNTQAIVHDESSLGRVIDPAGGSYYVDTRTDEFAHAAWEKFTAFERSGGVAAALESGELATRLRDEWAQRRTNLNRRKDLLTGVTAFPDASESLLTRDATPTAAGALLPAHRYAEDFEALRDRVDAHAGPRPEVVLVTIGPVAAHSGRLGFAREFVSIAGLASREVSAGKSGDLTGATVVLCSSDAVYAERGADVLKAVRDAGASTVLLAGKARDDVSTDGAIFLGCDALEVLTAIVDGLGVAK